MYMKLKKKCMCPIGITSFLQILSYKKFPDMNTSISLQCLVFDFSSKTIQVKDLPPPYF